MANILVKQIGMEIEKLGVGGEEGLGHLEWVHWLARYTVNVVQSETHG